jgi:hypothetical protein
MKKLFAGLAAVLMLTACTPTVTEPVSPSASDTAESFLSTTLTTGPNFEFEEPAYTDDDTIAEPEPVEPPNLFDTVSFTVDYDSASNTATGGLFAYYEDNIYYSNKNDNRNLYRKGFDESGTGTKIADAGPSGVIRSISIWNGYIYYITDSDDDSWNVYKLSLDGGEPVLHLNNVGDYFSVSDNIQVFTLHDDGLYAERFDGDGGAEKIDNDPVSLVHFTNGEITYFDGENIKVYDMRTGDVTFSVSTPEGLGEMKRVGDIIFLQNSYQTPGNSLLSEVSMVDIKTSKTETIAASQINFNVTPDDQYFSGQEFIPQSFGFWNGLFYYNVYRDYTGDGFNKRITYSKNLQTLITTEVMNLYYDNPQTDYGSGTNNTFYNAPDGLYEYNPKGEIENIGLPKAVKRIDTFEPEYMAAANSVFYGQFAFDDEYVYYKNINDNNNLYKKAYDSDDAGVKLADSNAGGHIYGICVYGDEVFYVTNYYDPETATGTDGGGSTAYAVKKDGSSKEPLKVLEGIGDYFYIYNGVIYYTGGLPSVNEAQLLKVSVKGGTPEKIADFAMYMSVAKDIITYSDSENIHFYNIDTGENVIERQIPQPFRIDSIFRYGDYVIFHKTNEISAMNIFTGVIRTYNSVEFDYKLPMSFNIYNGDIYYNTYKETITGEITARILTGFAVAEWVEVYSETSTSTVPYRVKTPDCALFATPNGLYEYAPNGELVKVTIKDES